MASSRPPASTFVADPTNFRCGFMTKRGGFVKSWLRRLFVLDVKQRTLQYFPSPEVRPLSPLFSLFRPFLPLFPPFLGPGPLFRPFLSPVPNFLGRTLARFSSTGFPLQGFGGGLLSYPTQTLSLKNCVLVSPPKNALAAVPLKPIEVSLTFLFFFLH